MDGDESLAEKAYLQAISLDDNYAKSHSSLAILYQRKQDVELATLQHDRAIYADCDFADAYVDKGLLVATIGNTAEGESLLKQALTIDPQHVHANQNLGKFALDAGEFRRTQELIEGVVAKEQKPVSPLNKMGLVYSKLSDNVDYLSHI